MNGLDKRNTSVRQLIMRVSDRPKAIEKIQRTEKFDNFC